MSSNNLLLSEWIIYRSGLSDLMENLCLWLHYSHGSSFRSCSLNRKTRSGMHSICTEDKAWWWVCWNMKLGCWRLTGWRQAQHLLTRVASVTTQSSWLLTGGGVRNSGSALCAGNASVSTTDPSFWLKLVLLLFAFEISPHWLSSEIGIILVSKARSCFDAAKLA